MTHCWKREHKPKVVSLAHSRQAATSVSQEVPVIANSVVILHFWVEGGWRQVHTFGCRRYLRFTIAVPSLW